MFTVHSGITFKGALSLSQYMETWVALIHVLDHVKQRERLVDY